ncbi:FG-GAP repeat protein [compost metagenome]
MCKIGRIWLACVLIICITGCTVQRTPMDLMRAPQPSLEQSNLHQSALRLLPQGTKLAVPKKMETGMSAIIEQDLNGDTKPEAIVFFRKEPESYEFGYMILEQSVKDSQVSWKRVFEEHVPSRDIDFVKFVDLAGDGNPKLVTGWSGGNRDKNEIHVTAWAADGGYQSLTPLTYSAAAIDDLDNDGIAEIVVMQRDEVKREASASLYRYQKEQIQLASKLRIDGGFEGYDQVEIAPVAAGIKGVFVHAGMGAHSSISWLLKLDDEGNLVDVLNEDPIKPTWMNPKPVLSTDLNGDGYFEVDRMLEPLQAENIPMFAMPWIHELYQWSPEKGMIPVLRTYLDMENGFRLDFPMRWDKRMTLVKDEEKPSILHFSVVQNEMLKEDVFRVEVVPIKDVAIQHEKWRAQGAQWVSIGEIGSVSVQIVYTISPQKQPKAIRDLLPTPEEWAALLHPLK